MQDIQEKGSYKPRAWFRHDYKNQLQTSWCGHKVDIGKTPVGVNCPTCAFYWFGANKEFTQACIQAYEAGYERELIQTHGSKFVKQLRRFIEFMAQKEQVENWRKLASQQES
jgi:hypothetical protein